LQTFERSLEDFGYRHSKRICKASNSFSAGIMPTLFAPGHLRLGNSHPLRDLLL
jgi:hypothetical protein